VTATTWTMRLARMLGDELAPLKATEAAEPRANSIDGEIGDAAVAAAMAAPAGAERDLQIALWARRIAAGGPQLAFVVALDTTADEILTIARITTRVRELLRGGL
jgi:hypothetical protein